MSDDVLKAQQIATSVAIAQRNEAMDQVIKLTVELTLRDEKIKALEAEAKTEE